jgi:GMP synthase (glutamine-hydrolysing)
MPGSLLVVQHEDDCPAGWLGEWMSPVGVVLDVCRPYRGDALPTTMDGHDALLVLGGAMGAGDDDRCPWLPATRALIRDAVGVGAPLLGVCLGHQLVAAALGGTVVVNPQGRSLGITEVRRNEQGRADPLLSAVPDGAVAVQWNNDVVANLPGGATVLARDGRGDVQVARFTAQAWGVQFHPEVSPAIFRAWVAGDPDGKGTPGGSGPGPAEVVAQIDAAEALLRSTWQPFAERFAELVLSAPVPR